jgi:hypothetical protein
MDGQRNELVPSTGEERAVTPASVIKSRRLICLLQLDKRRHSPEAVSKLLMRHSCRLLRRNSRYIVTRIHIYLLLLHCEFV